MKPTWKRKLLVIVIGYLAALVLWSTLEVRDMEALAYVAVSLVSLLGIASVVAAITPSPKDDEVIGQIFKIIHMCGLNFKGKGR